MQDEKLKTKCKVNGCPRKGVMCGWVIVGGVYCGSKDECIHKERT